MIPYLELTTILRDTESNITTLYHFDTDSVYKLAKAHGYSYVILYNRRLTKFDTDPRLHPDFPGHRPYINVVDIFQNIEEFKDREKALERSKFLKVVQKIGENVPKYEEVVLIDLTV